MQVLSHKSFMNLYHIHNPTKQPVKPRTLLHSPNIPPPNSELPIQKNITETMVIIEYITNLEPITIYYSYILSITNLTIREIYIKVLTFEHLFDNIAIRKLYIQSFVPYNPYSNNLLDCFRECLYKSCYPPLMN